VVHTTAAQLPPAAPIDLTATPPAEAVSTEQPAVGPSDSPPAAPTDAPAAVATEAPTTAPVQPTPVPPTPVPPTAVPPTSVPTTAPAQAPPPAAASLVPLEQEMFAGHNSQRANSGLAGLTLDARLLQVARQRAQDMAAKNYFSHTSPSGETAFTILEQIGYAYQLAGENIARNNYPDAQSVQVAMTGFMNSASHRENILEPVFKRVGIGVAIGGDGMKYFAVVFSN
jgi:uncharacterized protein YkwD